MSDEIRKLEQIILIYTRLQRIVCQKIETDRNLIGRTIYHVLMTVNKELETLSYCKDAMQIGASQAVVRHQMQTSKERLKKYHSELMDIIYK